MGHSEFVYERSRRGGGDFTNNFKLIDAIGKNVSVRDSSEMFELNLFEIFWNRVYRVCFFDSRLVKDLEANCFTFDSYGKKLIKDHKLSPDSFIQMAQQYAFYR